MEVAYQDLVSFFSAMDEVFFSIDIISARVIHISSGCEKLYGHKASEFLTNRELWFELTHPDDKYIIDEEDEILARGGKVNEQYRIIRKDKAIRWVEDKIIPTFDEAGNLIRIDGIVRDITENKQAEEEQRKTEARYRQIVEMAQEGIWTIDSSDNTDFVNGKMADILGYAPEEMIGKKPYTFMEAKDAEISKARIAERHSGLKGNFETRFIKKSGEEVWVNISAIPVFDQTGNYTGSVAMVTDITRRKFNEEVIKKSEANLRTIFDNSDTSYVLISADLKIVSFNALAQKFTEEQNGKSLAINRPIMEYFAESRWPFIKENLEKVANGQSVGYEISTVKKDGAIGWNYVRWINVKNNENQSFGFILTNKDITETKVQSLEREKITADLVQKNKHLEQFTYIISHNLRAPVANIMGLSEMLYEDCLDIETKREVIDRISASIKNIDTVIQDLNNILQARELLNEKKQLVHFNELINAIKIGIHNKIISEKVQFNCQFEEADAIFTIPGYLYSIFYNLAANSIKYRQADVSPFITIKSHKIGDKIQILFKDNGKGIDLKKNGSQIFGLYKRFDNSTEGKGMGLFMVKTQVEALGGTIKVKSKVGEGTEFIIQFDL